MRLTTAFNKLLGLEGALVRNVDFTPDAILVGVSRRARHHRCPRCAFSTSASYDQHLRDWRHVPLGKWRILVRAKLCRLECPWHGVITEAVPWAEHESRFTLDFESVVAWLAREMSQTAVSRLVRISWETVGRILERVVGRHLDRERLKQLYVIGVDEVSYRKGHKYLTVVADHQGGGVSWVGEGRSRETLGRFFDEVGTEQNQKIQAVTMDMSGPYIAEVKERVPNAVIAFDPFHVVKHANEAVNEVRRTETRERKGSAEGKVLKGSRWTLLKAPESLLPAEKVRLSAVCRLNERVYRAYLLKEELRALYRCSPPEAPGHLDAWMSWARRSRLRPFVKLAKTLQQHRDGILAAIRLGLSNGRLEGLNNKIGVIKRRAFGFHSALALIAMVYLCCSKITINLPI